MPKRIDNLSLAQAFRIASMPKKCRKLVELMLSSGISQVDIAEATGLSHFDVNLIEQGYVVPDKATRKKIKNAINTVHEEHVKRWKT